MARVLIIADTHFPFDHKDYIPFVCRVRDKFKCDTFLHIGDEVDNHAISFHDSEFGHFSQHKEGEEAEKCIRKLYKEFPDLLITERNHSALPYRRAKAGGVPKRFLKTHNEAWGVPNTWEWHTKVEIDGVLYTHGTRTGKTAALNLAINNRQSAVQGHTHSYAGVVFTASDRDMIFGMNVGGGIDVNRYAFEYGKNFDVKPCLGCGVVIDGWQPIWVPMPGGSKPLPRRKKSKKGIVI